MKYKPKICVLFPQGKMGAAVSQYLSCNTSFELLDMPPIKLNNLQPKALVEHIGDEIKNLIIVDFSSPEVTLSLLNLMKNTPLFVVSGTSDVALPNNIEELKGRFIYRSNFSTGVSLAEACIEKLKSEKQRWELSIIDIHGKHKLDSPSQTAKYLMACWGDQASQQIVSIRTGNGISTHKLLIEGDFESITIELTIKDRAAFFENIVADIHRLVAAHREYYQ